MVAFLLFPFVQAYILIFRFVRPLQLHGLLKVLLGLFLGLSSLKIYVYLVTGGSLMDPNLGRTGTMVLNILLFSTLFLLILTVSRDLINLLWKLARFNLRASLIKSSSLLLAALFLTVSFAVGTIGVLNAFKAPIITRYSFTLDHLPQEADGLKLAVLADIHVSKPVRELDVSNIVSISNSLNPDLVLILGDFVDGSVADLDYMTRELFKLKSKYGIYAVSGNHEMYSGYKAWLDYFSKTMTFLENRAAVVTLDNGKEILNLAGVTDISGPRFGIQGADANQALSKINPKLPVVFMAHQPSVAIGLEDQVDLFLAGHTHGGLAPVIRSIVALANHGLVSGLYDLGREQAIVSNGTRLWMGMPFRIDNPAQIIEITLKSGGA